MKYKLHFKYEFARFFDGLGFKINAKVQKERAPELDTWFKEGD